jgi:Zn finger protein HypA/HybF involved in hydrogenase expression
MGATDEADVLQERWCCLTCSSTFRCGQLIMRERGLHCPKCDSVDVHPATGETVELNCYAGEVGTLN